MSEITMPVQATSVEYIAASTGTGPFVVPFSFFQTSDVKATKRVPGGNEVAMVLTTDFYFTDLSFPAGQEGIGFNGGGITLVVSVPINTVIKIYRDTVIDRVTNFSSTGPFSIVQLNHELTKIIAICQELESQTGTYLSLPEGSLSDEPFDASGRSICNVGESEDDDCLATNRQADAQGPNGLKDDDLETAIGAYDQWNTIMTITDVVIQGSVTTTTKLFDLMTQYFAFIQNQGGAEASFRVRYRYTVECYSEITKETNSSYLIKIPPTSSIPFHFMDIEQDIDYFNGAGTLIAAIDIFPVGANSGELYVQWGNMSVNTSEPR